MTGKITNRLQGIAAYAFPSSWSWSFPTPPLSWPNRLGFDGRRHRYKAADETGHPSELSTHKSPVYSPDSFRFPQIHQLHILSHLLLRQDPRMFTPLNIAQQELVGGGNRSSAWLHAPIRSAKYTPNILRMLASTCQARHIGQHAGYMVYLHFF